MTGMGGPESGTSRSNLSEHILKSPFPELLNNFELDNFPEILDDFKKYISKLKSENEKSVRARNEREFSW